MGFSLADVNFNDCWMEARRPNERNSRPQCFRMKARLGIDGNSVSLTAFLLGTSSGVLAETIKRERKALFRRPFPSFASGTISMSSDVGTIPVIYGMGKMLIQATGVVWMISYLTLYRVRLVRVALRNCKQ